ncbi:uncharacterized protein HGUI_01148 [Hanseniaspora guilliermondii]|uniref:SET domain-containing protein n=1 Tax=Hanseniaspora guilliermondii TaxID=56406 RepID=A0A1L0AZJ6_9ASCO|nr:uncharacterized protein HGUI_01148 [Hanseniaspora guilliermondii]
MQKTNQTKSKKYPFQVSPGPAVATLSELNINADREHNQIVKGIIAAEILSTNQEIPLPLKKTQNMEDVNPSKAFPNFNIEVNTEDYIVNSEDNVVSCICDQNNPDEEDDDEKEDAAVAEGQETDKEEEDEDEDSSLNDVFWLQCDHCNRWVHGKCYGLKDEKAIDTMNFHCHICSPQDHPLAIKKYKANVEKHLKNLAKIIAHNKSKSKDNLKKTPSKKNVAGNVDSTDKKKENKSSSTNKSKGNKEESLKAEKEADKKEPEEEQIDDTIKRVRLKNIRDLYGNIYYPLDQNEYVEAYVKKFLQMAVQREANNNSVLEEFPSDFENAKIDVKCPNPKSSDKFTGIPSLYVISKVNIDEGDLIHEIIGKVGDQKNYIQDPKNQYRLLGVCKPKVFFHPKWPIYIDMRHAGNNIRYVRRSCHPNCKIVASLKPNETVPTFYLKALKSISSNEELTLAWQWDSNHPIWKLVPGEHQLNYDKSEMKKRLENEYPDFTFDPKMPFTMEDISEPERYFLVYCIDTLLTMAECGCPNHKKCQLRNVKKYYTSVLKLKKSMTIAQMRYKTYDLLNKQKIKEPRQTSIINDMISKEENRYVNRFNNYKSFVDRKRKLEEMSTNSYDNNKKLFVDSKLEIKMDNLEKDDVKSLPTHHLPSPLSPKQYKLEMIAQYKLQDALENKVESIKKRQRLSLESSIPKFVNWIQNNKTINTGLLLKSAKVKALHKMILGSNAKTIDNSDVISNVFKGKDILEAAEEKKEKLKINIDTKGTDSLNVVNKASTPGEETHNKAFQKGSLVKSESDSKLVSSTSLDMEAKQNGENNQLQPIKKKMSFADYRKKSKPN